MSALHCNCVFRNRLCDSTWLAGRVRSGKNKIKIKFKIKCLRSALPTEQENLFFFSSVSRFVSETEFSTQDNSNGNNYYRLVTFYEYFLSFPFMCLISFSFNPCTFNFLSVVNLVTQYGRGFQNWHFKFFLKN